MQIRNTGQRAALLAMQACMKAAAAVFLAVSAEPGHGQQSCPSESQFLMAISKQGLDADRYYMVKGGEADRLVEEAVAVAGHFIPPYDYVLVVERDDYISVNPVRGGAMCMHWRLTPHDWRIVREIVFGKVS